MVGWFQDGWLRNIWKWKKSVCAWEYGIIVRVGWMARMGKNIGR